MKNNKPYDNLVSSFKQFAALIEQNNSPLYKNNIEFRRMARSQFLKNSMNQELLLRWTDALLSKGNDIEGNSTEDNDTLATLSEGNKQLNIKQTHSDLIMLQQHLDDKLHTDATPKKREENAKWMTIFGFSGAGVIASIMLVMHFGVAPLAFSPGIICVLVLSIAAVAVGVVGAGLFASIVIPKNRYNKQLSLLTQKGGSLVFTSVPKKPPTSRPLRLENVSGENVDEGHKSVLDDYDYSDDEDCCSR